MKRTILGALGMVALMLAVMILPLGGCAPEAAAPPEEEAPPGKVWNWYPSTWLPAGTEWDRLCYISDYITRASGGRIMCEPSAPGAICPVDEQLDMVGTGATDAMMPYPDYYSGKIPLCVLAANALYLLDTTWEMYQYIERQHDGRVMKLIKEEYGKYGDIHVVGPCYLPVYVIAASNVPLNGIDDIPGTKFRCGDVPIANALGALGAPVVWAPGTEIYTMLATGVVDAMTYGHPGDYIAMGFHEVSKYWIKSPIMGPILADYFVVNGTVWKELGPDLQAVVEAAVAAGNAYAEYASYIDIQQGWIAAEDYGIEIVEWPEEDVLEWKKTVASFLPEYAKDEASTEAVELLKEFIIEWKPALAELIGLK